MMVYASEGVIHDTRIPVSRRNYAVVMGLYGFDHVIQCYRYESRLDAIDDRWATDLEKREREQIGG